MWWTTLSSRPWDTKCPWTESPLAAVAGALVTCFPSCQLPLALSFSPPLCSVFVPLLSVPYFVTAGTELQAFHGVTWSPFQCNLTCFPDSLIWLLHLPVYSVYFQYAFFFSIPHMLGFPGGSDSKASVCNAGDPGMIPGLGRYPGEGNGSPFQYSCLENPMDGEAW